MVVLVEVGRKNYLASIVPVIVNAILNEHQLIVDIVAFVSRGDFPRSRLGEKQRGKILAGWVTRKMPTIAQFGIRDPDGADSQITEVPEEHVHRGEPSMTGQTMVSGADGGRGNIGGVSPLSSDPKAGNGQRGIDDTMVQQPYESSIVESPPIGLENQDPIGRISGEHELFLPPTPGDEIPNHLGEIPGMDYHNDSAPINDHRFSDPDPTPRVEVPSFDYGRTEPPEPRYDLKPTMTVSSDSSDSQLQYERHLHDQQQHQLNLDTGRESGDLWSLPSQQHNNPYSAYGKYEDDEDEQRGIGYGGYDGGRGGGGGGGGLRVANADPDSSDDEEQGWSRGSLRQGQHSDGAHGRQGRGARHSDYEGSGYGNAM